MKLSQHIDNLPLLNKLLHLMEHHKQLPLLTSVIVAVVVGLSVYLGYQLKPYNKLMGK